MANWHIEGEYFETCNCSYICPCIGSNLAARPTEGDCKAALAFRIDRGERNGVRLDGVSLIVLMRSPGAMAEGNIAVGLILDERADQRQSDAVAAIMSGSSGGPMAALAPLVTRMAGLERRPIRFTRDGMRFDVRAGELIDQAGEGVPSVSRPGEPIYLENTSHPVNPKLALAKATRSKFHAFGIDWDDASGTRNAHFAPFRWSA